MSKNPRKKEKHRLDRKKKRQATRRAKSASPAKRVSQLTGEFVECFLNRDWRERGQAVAFVLRRAGDGSLALGSYLVDLWCCGLKDVWVHFDVDREGFDDHVDRMSRQMDDQMAPADPAEVARVLAGGIRFATQNRFRLPLHYERWLPVFGPVVDWNTADISDFGWGDEGMIHYVGPEWDLARRLDGMSVDDFLDRPDVEYTLLDDDGEPIEGLGAEGDEGGEDDEGDEEYDGGEGDEAPDDAAAEMFNMIRRLAHSGESAIRRWCFSQAVAPKPMLAEALTVVLTAILRATSEANQLEGDEKDEEADEGVDEIPVAEIRQTSEAHVQHLLRELPADAREGIQEAIVQVRQYIDRFSTIEEMMHEFGVVDRESRGESEPEE